MNDVFLQSASEAGVGIVCALEGELGALRLRVRSRRNLQGLDLLELDVGTRSDRPSSPPLLAVVSGIGKVRAAHAAAVLIACGARRALLVVGTCGNLGRLSVGDLVHCTGAVQVDLAVRSDREFSSDAALQRAWREAVGGSAATFLTADRPVLSPWRRWRSVRGRSGACVADMETAAVAAVAHAAGVPWAALRTVSDGAGWFSAREFRRHYPTCAGRAADTVERLVTSEAFPSVAPRRGAG